MNFVVVMLNICSINAHYMLNICPIVANYMLIQSMLTATKYKRIRGNELLNCKL